MAADGMTARQIAPMLRRTIGQTFRLLRTHGIPVRRERRSLTMMLIRRVRDFARMGLSVRMAAHLTGRSEVSVEGNPPRQRNLCRAASDKIVTSVSDGCWGVLREASDRIGDAPHRIAGGLLEMISRRRGDLVERVLAPIATPSRPAAPISSLLSAMLEARI